MLYSHRINLADLNLQDLYSGRYSAEEAPILQKTTFFAAPIGYLDFKQKSAPKIITQQADMGLGALPIPICSLGEVLDAGRDSATDACERSM